MRVAEARVPTQRADRYLAQLCSHLENLADLGRKGWFRQGPSSHGPSSRGPSSHGPSSHGPSMHEGGTPPAVEGVQRTDTDATIRFADGACMLHATREALEVRVEAADDEALGRIRTGIGDRLETIGRREGITVDWTAAA